MRRACLRPRRKLFQRKDWPPGRAGMRKYLQHIRLIADNCRRFNSGDPDLCGFAGRLEDRAHKRMHEERGKIRAEVTDIVIKLQQRQAAAEAEAADQSE